MRLRQGRLTMYQLANAILELTTVVIGGKLWGVIDLSVKCESRC